MLVLEFTRLSEASGANRGGGDNQSQEVIMAASQQRIINAIAAFVGTIIFLKLFSGTSVPSTTPASATGVSVGGVVMHHSPSSQQPRKKFNTTAIKCPGLLETIQNPPYRSQQGEDRKLMEWFGGLCSGTYIEMGALDGVRYSNTFVFNQALKWRGVLIELMGNHYNSLKTNRPDEIATVHAGVCSSPTKLHYFGSRPATGGIYEFSDKFHRDKFWGGISLDDPRVQEIECDTLDSLLLKHAPETDFFDFFSLDVEKSELSVLQSINFTRTGFGIIFAEADSRNQMKGLQVRSLLESNGYTFLTEYSGSSWFMNQDFHTIYNHLS